MNYKLRMLAVAVVLVLLAGCAADAPARMARTQEGAGVKEPAAVSVGYGRVESVREVVLNEQKASNSARLAAAGLGQTMQGMLAPKPVGLELVVRMDQGESVRLVQSADVAFRPGDRVRVMRGYDGALRATY